MNGFEKTLGSLAPHVNGEKRSCRKTLLRGPNDWVCVGCGALLGRLAGTRLHVKVNKQHEYLVAFPATCRCEVCNAMNELASPRMLRQRRAATKNVA